MKKNTIYIALVALFIIAAGLIVYKYNNTAASKEQEVYSLLPRTGSSAQSAEWAKVKEQSFRLLEALKANNKDTKSQVQLATLYIHEARVTGNYAYYDKAALKYVNDALQADTSCYEAMILKSLLYLSQHHFADGLELAEKAKKINPYNAYVYGIAVDGNVEMGNYNAAVEDADKMLSIRPDLRSYSRASYLREIYGDYPGAIEAMKMAVDAGAEGDETTEWCRVQLGRLYEYTADLKNAEMHYTIALDERPGYAFAWAGMARVAVANKNYQKAIDCYRKADSLINDYSIKEECADAYALAGKKAAADSLTALVIDELSRDEQSGISNDNIGHYADRELAYAYLKVNNYDKALEHALMEYNRRPDNIDANETVAWVYYCKKQSSEALPYLRTALKTHSMNPVLLCRAGLIYASIGHRSEAKALLQEALSGDPAISEALKNEGLATLRSL